MTKDADQRIKCKPVVDNLRLRLSSASIDVWSRKNFWPRKVLLSACTGERLPPSLAVGLWRCCMAVVTDAGAGIRLHPADLPLVLQEQLDLLSDRRDAGASDAELAELVADLLCLQEW